jgi:hypothetical protein
MFFLNVDLYEMLNNLKIRNGQIKNIDSKAFRLPCYTKTEQNNLIGNDLDNFF